MDEAERKWLSAKRLESTANLLALVSTWASEAVDELAPQYALDPDVVKGIKYHAGYFDDEAMLELTAIREPRKKIQKICDEVVLSVREYLKLADSTGKVHIHRSRIDAFCGVLSAHLIKRAESIR